MNWYLAGIGYENGELRPGGAPGTDLVVNQVPGIGRAHCYDPVAMSVLIGMLPSCPAPETWVAITLEQAQAHYLTATGSSATSDEVQ
jgi:hypothetical protein